MKRTTCVVVAALALTGCSARQGSNTPRTAIEQLLLSGAVDRALEKFSLDELNGKTIFLKFGNLKAYDQQYVQAATRLRLARLGAVLVEKTGDAEYTVEVASGGLGTEHKTSTFGIPTFPVPNAPIPTPELNIYRSEERTGIVKLLILVQRGGKYVAGGHYYAKCDRDEHSLLGLRFQRADDIRDGWEKSEKVSPGNGKNAD